jgi:amino acid adenylation domain-containing protein
MDDISKRIAALSPAKRALLQQILKDKSSSAQDAKYSKRGLSATRERPARLPLSYAQQRLWFLDQLEGSSSEYNIREAWRLKGELDRAALERGLNALIARHETLRTRFAEEDGEPSQVIEPAVYVPLAIEDLSAQTKDDREKAIVDNIRAEGERPFDLGRGPLLRVRLLKLGECEHVLLCTFHHIIFDGWSVAVFTRDLSAFYEASRRGEDSLELKPLPVQYADYALWQRERLEGEELERQLAYWKKQLADAPALALPTDLARPLQPSFAGARHSLQLGPEIASRLKELSRQENATLFMALLAAFQLLLSRYSGQEDISVGIPAANRNHVELEELIGFFLDTLVLRTDLSGAPPFRELLRRVQKVTLEAYAHADVPFEKLVQELQPERSLNRTPLFQAFLNFLSFEDEPVRLVGLEAERCLKEGLKSKFDLTLYIREGDFGLYFLLAYSTELFLPETIAGMMRHFENLLKAIVADPEGRIGALPMLEPQQRRLPKVSEQAVRPSNRYEHFGREEIEQSLVARFAKQVRKAPESIAVRTAGCRWTYQELDQRSDRIAHGIVRRCGRQEQHIAVLLEHDAPMIAATLGVLKSGKAYVALDPAYPVARLANILEDAQVQTIISDEANATLAQELSAAGISVLSLASLEAGSLSEPLPLGHAQESAYLLYTSGSTGEPKAIIQSHRNVLHHIASYTNSLHLSGEDRLLLIASLGVDAAVQDIFGALLNGATVCPYDVRSNELGALAQWIAKEEISVFHATPSLYRYFVAALAEQPRRWSFPKLRLVVLGGEKVVPSDLELYKEHFEPGCLLVNGYGLSESTVSLQCFFDMAYENAGRSIPIGNAVEETEVLLLNAQGEPGQVCGEIALASAYLPQGYWRRPELTAAGFLADPQTPARRIYRTGDLGRLLPNGMIEFVGRHDFQLKIRGYRVECQEIELILSKHEQVAQAAVLPHQNEHGEQELIGYVVPRSERSISSRELRELAAQWLPSYMVPQLIVSLEKIPLTASGKINRQALPPPEALPGTARQSYVAPGTPTQQTIAEIWSELLKADKLGIHDDFFECGGHSLLATRLVSRIRRAFDVELPLRAVFEGPTIAEMSELIENIRWAAHGLESAAATEECVEIVL